jgi:transposase
MFSGMKTVERDLARELRRVEGLPIKEIARRLVVSTSSVSYWVRDVELTGRLTVNRTRKVQSIYGSIQEYAGFERPAWLE